MGPERTDVPTSLVEPEPDFAPELEPDLEPDLEPELEPDPPELAPEPALEVAPAFEIAEGLYGRDSELRLLREAFARIASNARVRRGGEGEPARTSGELVVVSGPSGIGKSTLVHEFGRWVTRARGRFTVGAFDPLPRDTPYRAIVAALEPLVAEVLTDDAPARWRDAIAAALGDGAALVGSIMPAIERVIGPGSALESADPTGAVESPEAARRKLGQALARLIRLFAGAPYPLVMFFDDVQWADAASMELLIDLTTATCARAPRSSALHEALLVIQAYRIDDADTGHPVSVALRTYERRGTPLVEISLGPLGCEATTQLVSEALQHRRLGRLQTVPEHLADERASSDVSAAAVVIWHRTSGNPFHVQRFLYALYAAGYLIYDPASEAFTLEPLALERAAISDHLAALIARQLGELPSATRDALVGAAALGGQFDTAMLARVTGVTLDELDGLLAPARASGLVVVASEDSDDGGASWDMRYRFAHDRIQLSAYEAASPEERERFHVTIGRHLLRMFDPQQSLPQGGDQLFATVHHLSRGLALIAREPERAQFAELAQVAARRARRAGAYGIAANLLRALCAIRDWATHHDAAFAAHTGLAEVLSLGGEHQSAIEIIEAAMLHVTPREAAALAALETAIWIRLGRPSDALVHGRRAAALLDIELPSEPVDLARRLADELGEVTAAIAKRPIEAWIDLPPMTDPDKLAAMALLAECLPAADQTEPALHALVCAKLATLSLRHGNCAASARGYASLAVAMQILGNPEAAAKLGKLGADLALRLHAPLGSLAREPAPSHAPEAPLTLETREPEPPAPAMPPARVLPSARMPTASGMAGAAGSPRAPSGTRRMPTGSHAPRAAGGGLDRPRTMPRATTVPVGHEITEPIQLIGDSVAFLHVALDAAFALLAAYRAAIDPATGIVDLAALARADREIDLNYLRNTAPAACNQAANGVTQVLRAVHAIRTGDASARNTPPVGTALAAATRAADRRR